MKARSRFVIITTTLAALSISAAAYAADWKLPGSGTVHFEVPKDSEETLSIKIEGDTSDVSVKDDGSKITVVTKLDCGGKSCIKTGIGVRDEHLHEHIEAKSFPKATLVIDKSKLAPAGAKASGDVPGELTFHGKTKSVTVHYTVEGGVATGSTKFKLTDFGLERAKKMGVATGKEVIITAKFKVSAG